MKGFELYKKKGHLSPSSASVFARCPRRYFYKCGCNLVTSTDSIPLRFGEAIHFALPQAYTGDREKAIKAFDSIWEGREGDSIRNRAKALDLIDEFIISHAGCKCIYKPQAPPKGGVTVKDPRSGYELPFAIDVGLPIMFVGRIDCCGRHRDNNSVVGVEYKTASRMGTTYFESFQRSPQIIGYALALEILSGEPVDTFFLEVLPTQKSSSTPVIVPINFMKRNYEDFIKNLQLLYQRLEICENEEEFPQNFFGCNSYSSYGMAGYSCEYAPLCEAGDWTQAVDFFEVNTYEPFIIAGKENETTPTH